MTENRQDEIKNILKFDGDLKTLQTYLSNYPVACLIFSAVWCPSCRRLTQHVSQIAPKYPNAIFVHIDVQNNPDLATHFNIVKIPHVKFVKVEKNKKQFLMEELAEVLGASSTRLKEQLSQLLPEEKEDKQEETED